MEKVEDLKNYCDSGSSVVDTLESDGDAPKLSIEPFLKRIHMGDCLELMAKLPPESISAVVTSPPYNIKNSTGNGLKDGRGGKWANAELLKGYDTYNDCMPYDEYVKWQRKCLQAMMRVLRSDGAIFYNHKWRVQGGLLQDRHDIVKGFPVRQIIIWQRQGGFNHNPGYFLPTYEVIYLITKPKFRLAPKAGSLGDVWSIPQARGNRHPAPFPVSLAERCINSTISGIIMDPFMGSGTTALAAEICGRDWVGFEISEEYCELARLRLDQFSKRLL